MRMLIFAYQAVGDACLERLLETPDECLGVVTHRDDGDERIWFRSVAERARKAGVPVHYAEDLGRDGVVGLSRDLGPDVIYSFYFRNLLPEAVLRGAGVGAFNLHGSLLPRYRGRCPVNWVIVNQERETGVTLHHMVARADAGDIVGQRSVTIAPRETASTLYAKLIPVAVSLLTEFHPQIRDGSAPRTPQDERVATYYGARRPEDGRIDWKSTPDRIDALVRAVTQPFPGAFTTIAGRRLVIWESRPVGTTRSGRPGALRWALGEGLYIACGSGEIEVVRASWEGTDEIRGEGIATELFGTANTPVVANGGRG